jgi:hypothetical protein
MEACYGRAVQGEGSFGTSFPRTVNAGISQSCSTLTRTTPTNVRRGICKGSKLAADEESPRAIGSTGAPSLLMVVFAAGTSSYGRTYHLNTDISWIMKLRYSYHPGQQHGTTDLVYSGSVILLILTKNCYGRFSTNQCHTGPPTLSVVLADGTPCYGRMYHLNTDISWIMKLQYSYHPEQQHGTTDLVYFGSVILLILMKNRCGRSSANQCHTGPPTFSVVLADGTPCYGRMYHFNTDTSWIMKLRYSYHPGQQHGTTDLVPFGSVILWTLIKIGYRHIFSNHCYTRPPTFSVVSSLDQGWVLRTPIPGPHHTKGPLTPLYFSSATIDPRTYATGDCYAIMLARTGLPDPYYYSGGGGILPSTIPHMERGQHIPPAVHLVLSDANWNTNAG